MSNGAHLVRTECALNAHDMRTECARYSIEMLYICQKVLSVSRQRALIMYITARLALECVYSKMSIISLGVEDSNDIVSPVKGCSKTSV